MILKGIVFVLAALAVAIGVVAFAQFQSSLTASTPTLTTDTSSPSKSSPNGARSSSSPTTIAWKHRMGDALDLAKTNNGLVIVDVYTDWCGWCKRMDKDIYEAPSVAALSSKHVFVKCNAEDGGEGESFARKMNVHGFPTTIILNSRGDVIKSASGYLRSPENFIRFVESAGAQ
jgi:thiol:disulfide interchange protein